MLPRLLRWDRALLAPSAAPAEYSGTSPLHKNLQVTPLPLPLYLVHVVAVLTKINTYEFPSYRRRRLRTSWQSCRALPLAHWLTPAPPCSRKLHRYVALHVHVHVHVHVYV